MAFRKYKGPGPGLAPAHADFHRYARAVQAGKHTTHNRQGRGLGFLPPPVDLSHLKGRHLLFGEEQPKLPAQYDLRQQGRVTPVKDQGLAGTCWAFASLGSLESCLLPQESWDFSENNLKNLMSDECPGGYDRRPDEGGNQFMSTAYLARWTGPVTEAQDPYDPYTGGSCEEFAPAKHIQQVVYIPDRKNALDNNNIKEAVMKYGAVYTTFFYGDNYYNPAQSSYYYSGQDYANHAVAIVGWNDNYDRKKFSQRPKANGAFIVKNSWGTDWGQEGYFYISYYDSKVGQNNALFNNAESPAKYNVIHQYDPLGWVASGGYGSTTAWFANMFEAPGAEELQAVAWYVGAADAPCQLYLYIDPQAGNPRTGTLAKNISRTISQPGYYTFTFKKPQALTAGQRFAVVVKQETPGYDYPIPVEMPLEGYSSKATAQAGQGYISEDGATWTDVTEVWADTSVCLKAFGARTTGAAKLTTNPK